MLQHDFKTHEKRWTEKGMRKVETVGWCICGSWTNRVAGAYVSDLLEEFLGAHLVEINEARIEAVEKGTLTI